MSRLNWQVMSRTVRDYNPRIWNPYETEWELTSDKNYNMWRCCCGDDELDRRRVRSRVKLALRKYHTLDYEQKNCERYITCGGMCS